MNLKCLLIFGLLFLQSSAWASIKLNIIVIHKKGVSKELVLTNELHTTEITEDGRSVTVSMNNGFVYTFLPRFVDTPYEDGPSSILEVETQIFNSQGKLMKVLDDVEGPKASGQKGRSISLIQLGSEKKFFFDDHLGQQVEVTVMPTMIQ